MQIERINSGAAHRLYNGKIALTVAHGRLSSLEHLGQEYLFSYPNRLDNLVQPVKWNAEIVDTHLEVTSEAGPEGCQVSRKFYLGATFGLSESIKKVSGLPQRLAPSIVLTFPKPGSITAEYLTGAPQVPEGTVTSERNNVFTLAFSGEKCFTTGLNLRGLGGHLPSISVELRPRTESTLCLFMESRIASASSDYPAEVFAQEHAFQIGFSAPAVTLHPGEESETVSIFGLL